MVRFLASEKRIIFLQIIQTSPAAHTYFCHLVSGSLSAVQNASIMKLTTCLHPVSWLGMSGVIIPLPSSPFIWLLGVQVDNYILAVLFKAQTDKNAKSLRKSQSSSLNFQKITDTEKPHRSHHNANLARDPEVGHFNLFILSAQKWREFWFVSVDIKYRYVQHTSKSNF